MSRPDLYPPPSSAQELRWRRVFPGREQELSTLRQWLSLLLPDCPSRYDVSTVACELATNALRHTASGRDGWFGVEITWYPSAVRVTVADSGAPTGPRMIDDPQGENGRGLLMVAGLSTRTGVSGDHRGRLMWAEVPWLVESVAPEDGYEAAIHDGQATLARQFSGVSVWFGRSTLQWWAVADGELMTASSAQELATLIGSVVDPAVPAPSEASLAPSAAPEQRRLAQPSRVRAPEGKPDRAWRDSGPVAPAPGRNDSRLPGSRAGARRRACAPGQIAVGFH